MSKPEKQKEFLRKMYESSHRHWLQKSRVDDTRVCPCCGWSPAE